MDITTVLLATLLIAVLIMILLIISTFVKDNEVHLKDEDKL
jgi:hypothetical protein